MSDLIALAKQAGATTYTNRHFADRTVCAFLPEKLQAFADLIRQDEREVCASLCAAVQYHDIVGAHPEYMMGNDMTDQKINHALALAIGWTKLKIYPNSDTVGCWVDDCWWSFDYRDTSVIWPIAARFNAFPYKHRDLNGRLTGRWIAWLGVRDCIADSPQKAVAMAVIGAKK